MEAQTAVVEDTEPSPSSPTRHSSSRRKDRKDEEEDSRGKRSSRRDRGDEESRHEEDRLSRSRRHEKEDRDGKRKSGRSSTKEASDELPKEHKSSSRKSGKSSSDHHHHRSRSPRRSDKSHHRSSKSPKDDEKDEKSSPVRDSGTASESARTEQSPPRHKHDPPRSKSPKRDEKAAYRSIRNDGSVVAPGAQAESSAKRDEKAAYRSVTSAASVPGAAASSSSTDGKERRSTRATKPGAEASTANHKSMSKSSARADHSPVRSSGRSTAVASNNNDGIRRDEKVQERRETRATRAGAEASTANHKSMSKASAGSLEDDIMISPVAANTSRAAVPKNNSNDSADGEEPLVAALLVEDDDDDEEKEEKENAKRKSREQARTEQVLANERMQLRRAEQQRQREEQERIEADRAEKLRKTKQRKSIACIVLVLVIGGGLAAYFASQGGSSSGPVNPNTNEPPITVEPIGDLSASPTLNPTDNPTIAPTGVPQKYEPPSLRDCERIAAGLPIDGEKDMLERSFAIPMEVDILDGNDINLLVPDLQDKIEKLLVPDLIGCPREFFATSRRLGQRMVTNNESASEALRKLQSVKSIRYAVAKAIVRTSVSTNACTTSTSPNCSVVNVILDLRVRGQDRVGLLSGVILEVFPKGKDIRPDLGLRAPFDTIVIGIMRSRDPTQAPSVAPSGLASGSPTDFPTNRPSITPTSSVVPSDMPSAIPTSPPIIAPSAAPSEAPSDSPSSAPTSAPTPTPPPTVYLQPTPLPSATPSRVPSIMPSFIDSAAPSTRPSETAATPAPTKVASAAPSPAPSIDTEGLVSLLNSGMYMDQSSTLNHAATKGLDGNFASFSQTNIAANSWWRVRVQDYYGQLVNVNKVTVYNIENTCCRTRLAGAVVRLFGLGDNNILATSSPLTEDLVQTVDFGEVVGVQYVQVFQSKRTYLNVGEIEAWGTIPNGPRLGFVPLLRTTGMTREQSSNLNRAATQGLDGSYATFSQTALGTNNWWRVRVQDFYGQLVTVNQVTVWTVRHCCTDRIAGAVVKLFGAGTNNLIATSAPLGNAVVQTVDFGEVIGVQYVQVHQQSKSTYLNIAEIEAWGSIPNGSNSYTGLLKEGMYVDQSSTLNRAPELALDGQYNTFTQTALGNGNWWRVRIQDYYGKLVTVNKVTVWNRKDCCQDRLAGAVIQLLGANNNVIQTSAALTTDEVQTIDFGEVTGVAWVKVYQGTKSTYLNIVEIEAWGSVQ